MKKARIILTSISLLGIAGSFFAFKANRTKSAFAYYTYQYRVAAPNTFTKASGIPNSEGPVYYTLVKNAIARIYASLEKNQ